VHPNTAVPATITAPAAAATLAVSALTPPSTWISRVGKLLRAAAPLSSPVAGRPARQSHTPQSCTTPASQPQPLSQELAGNQVQQAEGFWKSNPSSPTTTAGRLPTQICVIAWTPQAATNNRSQQVGRKTAPREQGPRSQQPWRMPSARTTQRSEGLTAKPSS